MKKFAIFAIVTIIIVLLAILVLAIAEPTDITVSRSVLIKAPKDSVFAQMAIYKNWPNWIPWYQMDSSMKMTFTGAEGQAGSGFHWSGDEHKTGDGEIRTDAINGTEMAYSMSFLKPNKGSAAGTLLAKDTAGMTLATWTLVMHTPFPKNAMNAFINMDKLLGDDFTAGLNNMKQHVEGRFAATDAAIKEIDFPEFNYAGIRQVVGWNDLMHFFETTYAKLDKELNQKTNGSAVGIFYNWDTTKKQADIAAAFPISDTVNLPKDLTIFHAGPAKAYMAVEKGGYSGAANIHGLLQHHVAAAGKRPLLVMEEYVIGPFQQADSTKWVTNIYYLVQ